MITRRLSIDVFLENADDIESHKSMSGGENSHGRCSSVWEDFSELEQLAVYGLASLSNSRNSTPFSPLESPQLVSLNNDVFHYTSPQRLPEFSGHLQQVSCQRLVGASNVQLSVFEALTQYCPIIVVNRGLINIIKCWFLDFTIKELMRVANSRAYMVCASLAGHNCSL